ncbi:UvrD-helicase domain-containing protein [Methanosphaera sp.]|uniref:UvrD-helicase domain-containing protein n=1 Tax=Methanosphaera sp. TaxID=2666342 RepID=UPI0034CD20A2
MFGFNFELLEENNYPDYNQLQIKTLELLNENQNIALHDRFKNILIDEFQDIDSVQMRIC